MTAASKTKKSPDKTQPSPGEKTLLANVMDIYLVILLVSAFAYLSFSFLSPFLSVILWATIFAVSLYPAFNKMAKSMGGRYKLSATIIAILGLGLLIIPTIIITDSAANSARNIVQGLEAGTLDVPPANEGIKSVPGVGQNLFEMWDLANTNLKAFVVEYESDIKASARKVVAFGTSSLVTIGQLCLSIIFAAVFMVYAPSLAPFFKKIATRIDNNNGEKYINMTSKVIQNVAKGVLGVAFIQAGLAAVGFFGINMVGGTLPFPALWTLAVFAMSIVTLPIAVLVPSIILIWTMEIPLFVALIYTVFMCGVTLIDNILKPVLMGRGLTTPVIVIFIGVVGGTFSMGLLGLFIGPVVMALFYHMFELWMAQSDKNKKKI